jgi:PAS domain S-box-containing protein
LGPDLCQQLWDFFENGPLASRWVGPDGTILRANHAELEMMGWPAHAYVGRNLRDFFEDPQAADDFLTRVASGDALRDYPARLRLREGAVREVLIDANGYWNNGELRHARCFTRDATRVVAVDREKRELTESLAKALTELEGVLAVVPVGIGISIDSECREIRVNPAFAEQLGIRSSMNASKTGDGAAQLPFRVMKDGVEVHGPDLPMQRAARLGATTTAEEFDIVHDDGRVVRLLEYAAPLKGVSGEPRGSVGAFVDITRRREADLERERLLASERAAREEAEAARADAERAREAAEAANKAKSDFLTVMSHELRTPLNAIGGYVELIELGLRGPVTEQQREDLARVQKNQKHLLGLINQVLNYAKVERGSVHYQISSIPLTDVLGGLEPLVAPQLGSKGIAFRVEGCAPGLAVLADREKLSQILLNLLSNAAKFNVPGGEVVVACEARDEDVLIRVRDTGSGIPEDRIKDIFEPFVQIDTNLTRTEEGVGLGLAISRDLARGMSGDLAVESRLGDGSTFTLRLRRTV